MVGRGGVLGKSLSIELDITIEDFVSAMDNHSDKTILNTVDALLECVGDNDLYREWSKGISINYGIMTACSGP